MFSTDDRPPLLKLGIVLLAVNAVFVIGLCAVGGILGSMAVVLSATDSSSSGPSELGTMAVVGAVVALVLFVVASFSVLSLGVCAMAWRGSRPWIAGLVATALLNCIVLVPNPLGIVAAVLSILGALEFLEKEGSQDKIASVGEPATASTPDDEAPSEGTTA